MSPTIRTVLAGLCLLAGCVWRVGEGTGTSLGEAWRRAPGRPCSGR